jgi:hypothetical protein
MSILRLRYCCKAISNANLPFDSGFSMLKTIAFLPAILLVAGVPALAQAQQQQPQAAQQPQQQSNSTPALDPNRKICKTEELIGSKLGASRVCKTAAQWEAERKRNAGTDQQ